MYQSQSEVIEQRESIIIIVINQMILFFREM